MQDLTIRSSDQKTYSVEEVAKWFHMVPFGNVSVGWQPGCGLVKITTRTTKPRAGSIATRVKLILQEKFGDVDVEIVAMGREPEANDQIGSFLIIASLGGVDWLT